MSEIMMIFSFLLGILFLIKGADLVVKGASVIAIRYGISTFTVGAVIIAFGTSFPELMVSILLGIEGNVTTIVGMNVGSNVINIIIGVPLILIFNHLFISKRVIQIEFFYNFIAIFYLLIPFYLNWKLSYIFAYLGVGFTFTYYFHIFKYTKKKGDEFEGASDSVKEIDNIKNNNSIKISLITFIGFFMLYIGGEFVVYSVNELAVYLKTNYHMDRASELLGITLIAMGTSLPEFITIIISGMKKSLNMGLGTILGSNIINIFINIGAISMISSIEIPLKSYYLIILLLIVYVFLIFAIYIQKRKINKKILPFFLLLFCIYIYIIIYK